MPKITYIEHNGKSHTVNIPNELTDAIREKGAELGIDMDDINKRLH